MMKMGGLILVLTMFYAPSLFACPTGYTCPAGKDCISDSTQCVVDTSSSSTTTTSSTSSEPATTKEQMGLTYSVDEQGFISIINAQATASMVTVTFFDESSSLRTGVSPPTFDVRGRDSPLFLDPGVPRFDAQNASIPPLTR
ncbi:MAG: hypothetical protein HY877_01785 [Deltaproteobacteria bacterium]|nr:hypothetical protein [Deltaproteobacteria bacterium]